MREPISLPPRFVAVACLFQFSIVIGGYLVTRGFLRAAERFYGPDWGRLRGPAWFVMNFGPWLLLVPALWFAGWIVLKRRDRTVIGLPGIIAGIAMTIAMAVVFAIAAIQAFGGVFPM